MSPGTPRDGAPRDGAPRERAADRPSQLTTTTSRGIRLATQPGPLSAILVAATLLFVVLETLTLFGGRSPAHAALSAIAPLAGSAMILQMRRAPWLVLGTAMLAYAARVIPGGSSPICYILIAVGCASIGAWGRAVRFAVLVVAVGALIVELFNPTYGPRSPTLDAASVLYSVVLPVLVGALAIAVGLNARQQDRIMAQLKSQHERLNELQRRETDAAVSIERTRIARELHDVVAHHISALLIQAEAGHRTSRPGSPDQIARWLTVSDVARETLVAMRRVVRLLRADDAAPDGAGDPQPRLRDLDRLLADVRRNGLDVRLTMIGGVDVVSADIQLCAYRIVQEGLTNVLRHASASRADVVVAGDGRDLTVELSDDGRVDDGFRAGNGLLGMRERAAAVGGRLEISAEPGSGLRIRAILPAPTALPSAPPVPTP